ncbi:Fic family protein [Candidatus Woesearchaeota archaeon]|nr:Fic family protein [Candidatus Woesearchaeota archaeon]
MATIRRKVIGNQTYYYLAHTFRKGTKTERREHYLGKKIPSDIEQVKKEFFHEMYKERWYPSLDRVKAAYGRELKLTPPSARTEEREKFAIRFTYDTQRMEGSTLSFKETADLLERGITPREKPVRDVKEAEAHNVLFGEVLETKKEPSLQLALYWHRRLFLATKTDIAGRIRQHQVLISRSRFVPPSPVELAPLLYDFFRWYAREKGRLHPVELAALVHLRFVTIHPFSDGNGRMSRLLMNFVLHRHRYPLLNIPYTGRNSYYSALERSQTKKQEHIFVQWLIKRYLREYARFLG